MTTRKLVRTALFAALTAVGAFLKIPLGPSAITLQFFFTAMAGCLLGSGCGALSQLIYVLLGLLGLPYMAMILNGYMGKGMDLSAILWAGMLPFLPGDAMKILVTTLLTPPIRRALDNSAK